MAAVGGNKVVVLDVSQLSNMLILKQTSQVSLFYIEMLMQFYMPLHCYLYSSCGTDVHK